MSPMTEWEYPCRELPTRHCPVIYDGVCGDRPCARIESEDTGPWVQEIQAGVLPRRKA